MCIAHFGTTFQEPCSYGASGDAVLPRDGRQGPAFGVDDSGFFDLLIGKAAVPCGSVSFDDDTHCSSFNSIHLRQFTL